MRRLQQQIAHSVLKTRCKLSSQRVWDIRSALDWTVEYLTSKGDSHPRRSAEWLLSEATGLSRIELYAYHNRPLSPDERATLREGVRRRACGEPLQYVTGEVAFRHIVVQAQRGALIPRPETELLVEHVLCELDRILVEKGSAKILEIGTGTGIIALSLACERPDASLEIVATDISPEACNIARSNVARLDQDERISVIEGDLADGVDSALMGSFDILVSNPPYIPTAEVDTLDIEVRDFEPRLALDGGADGLDVFRRLLTLGTTALTPQGFLAVELHENTLCLARSEALEWYIEAHVHRDLAGRDRILTARLNR